MNCKHFWRKRNKSHKHCATCNAKRWAGIFEKIAATGFKPGEL